MARRGVFFQMYLNPKDQRDQAIISWLAKIPRFQRSQRVKDILSRHIQGGVPGDRADRAPTRPDAGRLASKLLGSLPKRRA